ncbi:MAG: hypothetical protein M3345_04220 [Actinomycetota bacterium]|nr:hypothetical protein [Actinomycetota bacterium]
MQALEQGLRRVPGILDVRVVGDGTPSEIHVVASTERLAKQIVRDVQSLAQAKFGIALDHRVISVVQLREEEGNGSGSARSPNRPIVEEVVLASRGQSGWVKVGLRWPDGNRTVGEDDAGASRERRAWAAAEAAAKALEPVLRAAESAMEIEQVAVYRLGADDVVLVRAVLSEKDTRNSVVGSALVEDDVATAAVRAALHAINRKLR